MNFRKNDTDVDQSPKKWHLALLLILLVFLNPKAYAQQLYLDSLYANEEVEKSTYTYYSKPNEELKLDLFEPVSNEDLKRPVVIYVHGGGFSGGKRDYPNHNAFLRHLSSKGYVTATMSYTLQMKGQSFGCNQPAPNKITTFLETARDINRASAFLIENRKKFAIDTTKIVLVGSSAGAEAVLHAAYWEAAKTDANAQILSPGFSYGGVISMAGAIANLKLITKETAIPTQLFHGTCDQLVPYGEAPHHYCATADAGYLLLYGAKPIADRLEHLHRGYYLVTGCNGGHEWASSPLDNQRTEVVDFLYHDVLQNQHRQIRHFTATGKESCSGMYDSKACGIMQGK